MSFYRSLITAIATLGLATSVFAADESATSTPGSSSNDTHSIAQTADASNATNAAAPTAEATEQKVDINKASAKELMKVKGLTKRTAKAIVAYRKAHGDFKSFDELKEVKGFKKMNEETMKGIEDHLTIG